ncbi:MAG: nucleotidyltransferase family protein [Brevinematales bacterium]|nr:nucleotidyltransferase family protein [Brevinematales bacterium]
MKTLAEIVEVLQAQKLLLEQKYHIREIGVFGSYVRGEQTEKSDLDILVSFTENPNLFEFFDLRDSIGKLLKTKVDLVTKDSLKPNIGKHILSEVKYL